MASVFLTAAYFCTEHDENMALEEVSTELTGIMETPMPNISTRKQRQRVILRHELLKGMTAHISDRNMESARDSSFKCDFIIETPITLLRRSPNSRQGMRQNP